MEIDDNGDISCLWTDEVNLFSIGRVTNVRKVSNIEFNENIQQWEVADLNGKILHTNPSREVAIEWEIVNFSPNEKYYDG